MYAKCESGAWTNATVISDNSSNWNTGISENPDIAIDNNGVIHVIWQDSSDIGFGNDQEIFYINNTGVGWSNPIVISDDQNLWNNESSQYPSIAIDNNDVIHVVWHDNTNGEWGVDTEIMYTNYTTSGWSNATVISDDYTGWNDDQSLVPKIATDINGTVHVVWYDDTNGKWGTDWEIMYANYTTSTSWSNATAISDIYGWNDQSSFWPDIATDSNGTVHVVWFDDTNGEWGNDREIMYMNHTSTGWSNASVISDDNTGWNDGLSEQPDITVDKDGIIHVVWQDSTDGTWGTDQEIMYSKYTVTGWSNIEVISDDSSGWNDDTSINPTILTDENGVVHVVWEDHTNGIWGIDIEIMYSNNKTSTKESLVDIILLIMTLSPESDLTLPLIIVSIAIGVTLLIIVVLIYRKRK